MSDEKLSAREKRFCEEYIIDLIGGEAAIRAGYSEKTADQQASRMLRKVKIKNYIAELMKEREKRTEITQDRVLKELARIAFFDIRKLYNDDGSLKRPDELDDDAASVLSGIDVVEMAGGLNVDGEGGISHIPMFTKKAKVFDKNSALTLAMRHLGMLNDKINVGGQQNNPLTVQEAPKLSKEEWLKAHGLGAK